MQEGNALGLSYGRQEGSGAAQILGRPASLGVAERLAAQRRAEALDAAEKREQAEKEWKSAFKGIVVDPVNEVAIGQFQKMNDDDLEWMAEQKMAGGRPEESPEYYKRKQQKMSFLQQTKGLQDQFAQFEAIAKDPAKKQQLDPVAYERYTKAKSLGTVEEISDYLEENPLLEFKFDPWPVLDKIIPVATANEKGIVTVKAADKVLLDQNLDDILDTPEGQELFILGKQKGKWEDTEDFRKKVHNRADTIRGVSTSIDEPRSSNGSGGGGYQDKWSFVLADDGKTLAADYQGGATETTPVVTMVATDGKQYTGAIGDFADNGDGTYTMFMDVVETSGGGFGIPSTKTESQKAVTFRPGDAKHAKIKAATGGIDPLTFYPKKDGKLSAEENITLVSIMSNCTSIFKANPAIASPFNLA